MEFIECFTNENTAVLAICVQEEGNTRALLMCNQEGGGHEFAVVSHFDQEYYDGLLGYECMKYAWRDGHYFENIIEAADYWKSNVLLKGMRCPECGETTDVEGGRIEGDYDTTWQNVHCNKCGCDYREVYKYAFTERDKD